MKKKKVYILADMTHRNIWAISTNPKALEEVKRQRDGEWDGGDQNHRLTVADYDVLTDRQVKERFKQVFCTHHWLTSKYGRFKCDKCKLEGGAVPYVSKDKLPKRGVKWS